MAWFKGQKLHPDDLRSLSLVIATETKAAAHAVIKEYYGPAILIELENYRASVEKLQSDVDALKAVLGEAKIQKALEILRS